MRLNSLQLTNFRQHAETRIEFDVGITGIIGPNGAGKSTVLEAIAWALYGQSAVRGTRDSIRNVRAGARAPVRVELDFDLSGHRYRVIRGLSNAELYLDGGSEPIATTITDVSDLLSRRLGMTRAEFFHTYFTGQKELAVMASMSPSERAQFLSRVLGYDRIRAAQGLARERRKLITAEISGVREMMPDPQRVTDALADAAARKKEAERRKKAATKLHREARATLQAIEPQWQEVQKNREAFLQLQSDLRLAKHEMEALSREADRLTKELEEIAAARAEAETVASQLAPLMELEDEWRMLDALSREEGRRRTLVDALNSLTDELRVVEERRTAAAANAAHAESITTQLKVRSTELEAASSALEVRRTDWLRDRQEALTKRESLRSQYQEVKDHFDEIVKLGEDGVCPTCQRSLGEHFRDVHENLEEQLETITVNGKYFNSRIEQLDAMEAEFRAAEEQRKAMRQGITDLERQLARAQSAAQEEAALGRDLAAKQQRHAQLSAELASIPTGFDEKRHAFLEREMERFAPLNEHLTRLGARIEREEEQRQAFDALSARLAASRERYAQLEARQRETKFSEEEMQRQRAAYEGASATLRHAELELQAAAAEETRAGEAAATAERDRLELERARELHARLESERRLHDELDRAYTDLRTDLNFQLRPELSDIASQFISHLTDGRYAELELDDQYSLVMLEDGIPKPVISGGEEDLSNLVLRLAISQMIADRSGQNFSLLVLDEVFGSLDVARRQNVVDLLRRLQDRFEQVILITHIEGVNVELDHVVWVEYDDQAGTTRVRQSELAVPELADMSADAVPAGAGS